MHACNSASSATTVVNVGYFEGQQHSKISIVTSEDLALWCDGSYGTRDIAFW